MLKCSRCGQHISRIDAKIGAEMCGQAEAVICCTCAVLHYWKPAGAGNPTVSLTENESAAMHSR